MLGSGHANSIKYRGGVKVKRWLFLLLLSLILISCVETVKTVQPTIDHYIGSRNFQKYNSIAVFPFSDAPNSRDSGLIIQSLAIQTFAKAGFQVIERSRLHDILNEQKLSVSGLIDEQKAIQLGKLIGVKAIAVGSVGQYSTRERHTDTVYVPNYDRRWRYSYSRTRRTMDRGLCIHFN